MFDVDKDELDPEEIEESLMETHDLPEQEAQEQAQRAVERRQA